MSLFVEVKSVDKGCPVIINLDSVLEIAPLATGGCALFFADSAAVGGKTSFKVSDSYELFKQFAIQPVSAADIARRFPKPTDEPLGEQRQFVKQDDELEIPTLGGKSKGSKK